LIYNLIILLVEHFLLRLFADYVNPITFDFWSKMKKAALLELGKKGNPLVVTGDGQEKKFTILIVSCVFVLNPINF